MIRVTDQYFWNFVFTVFFLTLVVMGAIILDTESRIAPAEISLIDIAILSLATFRLVRLFVYDTVTKWFREQFWDAKKLRGELVLVKPATGPRRTLADLTSCPWCIGLWAAAMVTFFYLWTEMAYFPVLLLAVAGIGSLFQLFANLVGWQAEKSKLDIGS